MSRLPIRLRLTLTFALVMALRPRGYGALSLRPARARARCEPERRPSLSRGRLSPHSSGRRTRASATAAGARWSDPDESFAQVIDESGAVVDSTPRLETCRCSTAGELERARRGTIVLDLGPPPGGDDPARVLATPVDAQGERLVVVVGASREGRDRGAREPAHAAPRRRADRPAARLARRLCAGRGGAPAGRVDAARGSGDLGASPGRRLPLSRPDDEIRRLGETLNEMLARLETALRPRARVRRRCEPRASNAAGAPQDGARARGPPAPHAGGAPERTSIRRGGGGPARSARGGPARDRPLGPRARFRFVRRR